MYYQPIMDCATETMTGAEALMKFTMIAEEGTEVISPMEFIPLLEETGLIIPAGRCILMEAAKMNINVSFPSGIFLRQAM